VVLNSTSTGAICFRTSNKSSKPSTKIITHLMWKPGNGAPAMFRDDCVTAFASAVPLAPILLLGADVDRENEKGRPKPPVITPLCPAAVPSQAYAVR
jgi:hypothetical protein